MVIGSDQYEFIKIDIFAIGYLQQTSGRMRYNKEIKNDMTRKLYFTILSLHACQEATVTGDQTGNLVYTWLQ